VEPSNPHRVISDMAVPSSLENRTMAETGAEG
jgi:hypothetical protein